MKPHSKEQNIGDARRILRLLITPQVLPLVILGGLVLFIYGEALGYAFFHGKINPSQSHATVVPFVSLLMIWLKRDQAPSSFDKSSPLGWPLLVFAFALHGLGILAEEQRLSLLSLVAILFAYVILVGGFSLARFLFVPILFLMFLIPYGHIEEGMSRFLRLVATRLGTGLALWTGVDAQVQGTVVWVSGSKLQIAAPCSGLRSLSTLLALAVVFIHLTEPSLLGKGILLLAAVPIAVLGNAVRLGLVLCSADSFGVDLAVKVHDYSGLFVFAFAFSCLLGLGRLLEWIRSRRNTGSSAP